MASKKTKFGEHKAELSWSSKDYIGDYDLLIEYDHYPEWLVVWTLTPRGGGLYGLSRSTYDSGPGVRSSHAVHYHDFEAKSLKAAKAHVEKLAIAAERAEVEGTPNPYMGDAVAGAKQRKYGYPKPPKLKKNPSTYTERDIEKLIEDEAVKEKALEALDLWRINKRREAARMMRQVAKAARARDARGASWLASLANEMEVKSVGLARLLSRNPTQQEHKKYALRNRKDVMKRVEQLQGAYAAHQARPRDKGTKDLTFTLATSTVVEGTRMFWNAYDAKDNGLAKEAAHMVLLAKDVLAELTGVPRPSDALGRGGSVVKLVFGVAVPNPRHTADRAAKRDKHKRKKGKKGSMSPYARKRAGGGTRSNPSAKKKTTKKKSVAALVRSALK